jgi:hypothetical protein
MEIELHIISRIEHSARDWAAFVKRKKAFLFKGGGLLVPTPGPVQLWGRRKLDLELRSTTVGKAVLH